MGSSVTLSKKCGKWQEETGRRLQEAKRSVAASTDGIERSTEEGRHDDEISWWYLALRRGVNGIGSDSGGRNVQEVLTTRQNSV